MLTNPSFIEPGSPQLRRAFFMHLPESACCGGFQSVLFFFFALIALFNFRTNDFLLQQKRAASCWWCCSAFLLKLSEILDVLNNSLRVFCELFTSITTRFQSFLFLSYPGAMDWLCSRHVVHADAEGRVPGILPRGRMKDLLCLYLQYRRRYHDRVMCGW